jgi:hypothetical protein
MGKRKPWCLARVAAFGVATDLFCGTATSFDAGAGGCEEGPGGAYHGKDSGWVFRGGDAASLRVQREGDGKQESEAEKYEGGSLH